MKKLSKILNESVWGGILSRSTGDSIRKEDDVNILDSEEFFDYLRSHYKIDHIDTDMTLSDSISTIFVPFCTAGTKNIKICALFFNYEENTVYTHHSVPKFIPELWSKLEENFDLWYDEPDYEKYIIINPKDTNKPVDNSYLLEVINFIIDNMDSNATPCIFKKTNESVWGGMLDRSTGDSIRKEDDIITYDGQRMVEYIIKHYRINDTSEYPHYYKSDDALAVPVITWKDKENKQMYHINPVFYEYKPNVIYVSDQTHKDTLEKIKSNPSYLTETYEYNYVSIRPKKGDVNNRFLLEVIDFILDITKPTTYPIPDDLPKHILDKKKVNESVWGGMLDRSVGKKIRKEDDPKYLNPKDFIEYIKYHYELVKKDELAQDIALYDAGNRIIVPIIESPVGASDYLDHKLSIYIDYRKNGDAIFIYGEVDKYKDILINAGIELRKNGAVYNISLDDDKTMNEMFLICLDLLIEGIPSEERTIRKKMYESVWGGMLDRSVGDAIRKEDVIDNETLKNKIKELYKVQGEGDTLDVSSLHKHKFNDLSNLFKNFNNVKQIIGLETWDVSNVTDMYSMFHGCKSLTELNISNWDVSNVTNMAGMFYDCKSLTELNISNWNVSNVTHMNGMFIDCSSFTELNIFNWDVSNVIDMRGMFYGCSSLKELNIDNWNVSNVIHMDGMFIDCNKLIKPKWYNV